MLVLMRRVVGSSIVDMSASALTITISALTAVSI
jgi:hypothetical protein